MKLSFRLAWATAFLAGPAVAQDPSTLTAEQVAIVYDQCLARAAGKASRTDVPPEAIYDVAKAACSQTRTMLIAGQEPSSERVRVLDEIDRERATSFPQRTREFREMLKKYKPQAEASN